MQWLFWEVCKFEFENQMAVTLIIKSLMTLNRWLNPIHTISHSEWRGILIITLGGGFGSTYSSVPCIDRLYRRSRGLQFVEAVWKWLNLGRKVFKDFNFKHAFKLLIFYRLTLLKSRFFDMKDIKIEIFVYGGRTFYFQNMWKPSQHFNFWQKLRLL